MYSIKVKGPLTIRSSSGQLYWTRVALWVKASVPRACRSHGRRFESPRRGELLLLGPSACQPSSSKAPPGATFAFEQLLIGYRSWPGQSCYITRMKKENIQSLDAAVKVFQNIQVRIIPRPPASFLKENEEGTEGLPAPLADRSILGTTINILCSSVPIYWA
uniref:BRICHOS domain-containing protein n=1 Tax=Podarcis muralis TaxID=64176 RepID=A0A670J337_PODMU